MSVLALLLALTLAPAADAPPAGMDQARQIEQWIDAGELDRAGSALKSQSFSPLVGATLQGRLALAQGRATQAERRFREASELAPDHAPLRILLAHAQIAGGKHRDALRSLRHKGLRGSDPAVALLRSTAHRGLDDAAAAYAALRQAALAHPDHAALHRELVLLCASQGLFEAAKEWAQQVPPATLGSATAVAALQQARTTGGGVEFSRFLSAAFADDAQIQAELGWVLSAAGDYTGAARALDSAARLGADTAFAAAEHYRAARRYRDALSANARVREPDRRTEQRFDILFESGRMARAIEAGKRLERSGSLSPRRRYGVAYAHYSLRQFAEASRHARLLATTSEAGRARALLRAMGR